MLGSSQTAHHLEVGLGLFLADCSDLSHQMYCMGAPNPGLPRSLLVLVSWAGIQDSHGRQAFSGQSLCEAPSRSFLLPASHASLIHSFTQKPSTESLVVLKQVLGAEDQIEPRLLCIKEFVISGAREHITCHPV